MQETENEVTHALVNKAIKFIFVIFYLIKK